MDVYYNVVWVEPEIPDLVRDVYAGYIVNLDDAIIKMNAANSMPEDGSTWTARIQRVTEEFI
jgi:hypothetical protein